MGTSPHQQASLTPQMSKRPQMGTHVVQQHQQQQQQQQIDSAITPLSGKSLSCSFFRHYSVILTSMICEVCDGRRRRAIRDGNAQKVIFIFC